LPALTRWSVKAAMVWLVMSLVVGMTTATASTLGLQGGWWRLTPLFWHFLTVGWATQLIFGVAYWMFPALSRERPYRSTRLAWAVFALLNAGLLARLLAEGSPVVLAWPDLPWMYAIAAAAQLAAGIGFVLNTWSRVRTK
jgi:hypothetical protein